MTERDWQMLTETPDEWNMLADIEEWMLVPYTPLTWRKLKELEDKCPKTN